MKKDVLKDLRRIPGVGPAMAEDLWMLDIRSVADLVGKNPLELYEQHNRLCGCTQDRCVLYVYRCAVYFAETPESERDPEKLKWWNWKDKQ